jgi:hypothetical protein
VADQGSSALALVTNTNTLLCRRWPQQASPAALWFTVVQPMPSFTTHQARGAGLSKSGPPHTPAAQGFGVQSPRRSSQSMHLLSLRRASVERSQGRCLLAVSRRFVASRQLFALSLGAACRAVRFSASNARRAEPAEVPRLLLRSAASLWQRPNPSVKGTSRKRTAPYLER